MFLHAELVAVGRYSCGTIHRVAIATTTCFNTETFLFNSFFVLVVDFIALTKSTSSTSLLGKRLVEILQKTSGISITN
jgi:hypothetical protein